METTILNPDTNVGTAVFLSGLWADLSVVLRSKLLPAVLIGVIGFWLIKIVLKVLTKILERSKLEKAAHSLIKSVAAAVMYVLLALMVASRLGIDVTGIIALASVLTLAVSLAVENALANVFGGFTLLYTQPFHSGDFVEIAGQSGTVREIGLAYTKLTTGDNKMVSIPNSAVTAAQIVNYSVTGTRRVDITVTASYDAAVDEVLEALKEAARVPTALEEPEVFAAVKNYGDSAIEYVLQVWSKSGDYWSTMFEVNKNIKICFDRRGIEMTYPHLNVHLDK